MMSYKDLEVWKLANDLVMDIHKMTLTDLPKFERHETGSQIRRSIKFVKANIAKVMAGSNIRRNTSTFW